MNSINPVVFFLLCSGLVFFPCYVKIEYIVRLIFHEILFPRENGFCLMEDALKLVPSTQNKCENMGQINK